MNIRQAQTVLRNAKRNVGVLLTEIRKAKPDRPLGQAKAELGANTALVHSIYRKFPELKPERVKQMSLNL